MKTRVAGRDFDLDGPALETLVGTLEPEPVHEHYTVIGGRRFPPKQVISSVTQLDRADFTTHQARSILRRLGFGVHRRSADPAPPRNQPARGRHGGAEAALLDGFRGRWVAQDGLEVVFDADSPERVLAWLRRHGRRARVWQVPASPEQAGSMQSTP